MYGYKKAPLIPTVVNYLENDFKGFVTSMTSDEIRIVCVGPGRDYNEVSAEMPASSCAEDQLQYVIHWLDQRLLEMKKDRTN